MKEEKQEENLIFYYSNKDNKITCKISMLGLITIFLFCCLIPMVLELLTIFIK
jgi:hypothetical protein